MLRRLLTYADKVFDLKTHLQGVTDSRLRARIETPVVVGSALVLKEPNQMKF